MASVPKPIYTEEEYLRRELLAEYKSEFYRGEIFAMAGGSPAHNLISGNLFAALHRQLEGSDCRPFASDQRIKVLAAGLTTYPDVSIVCGPWQTDKTDKQAITNPRVIADVLSTSTETYDRTKKFDLYKLLPSLEEYLLIWQSEPRIEQFVRQPDATWNQRTYLTLEDILVLQTLPIRIALRGIYRGLAFPSETPTSPAV